MISLTVLDYIAEEVRRQRAGPRHVFYMAQAWVDAEREWRAMTPLSSALIARWGWFVDPHANPTLDFRRVNMVVGERPCPDWERVLALMEQLLPPNPQLTPEEVYKAFEEIHPFRDGNGRTGKILYNYLRGTLDNPAFPPNFWGISNP